MKAKGKMPGEQPKSKAANLPNARIPNAERKPNVARRTIPEPKRTNADTKAQQNVTQDKRVQNKNQRKVLLPIKLKSPPVMPKLANPSSKSPTAVAKAPSLSTLPKAPIRTPNAPKPPIPPSKRSNSVPALKKKPETNRPQTGGAKVSTEKHPVAVAQQHCARKPAEKPDVEKVVSSCSYESSNGAPLKIFPSFRGEYPTRHRPTACLQQWFQRTAAGKSHTEAVSSIEIDDAGNDEVALDDNNCTTVTETHFLSIGCPPGCEPAAKTSCEYCVHVDTNNRRYEDYPLYSDHQTAPRRTEAFTQHHQQQQQQQPPPFVSNWSQTSGDRSPYSCYQQPLQTCEVWSQSCLPQQAYQANSLNAMWPSSGGQTLSQNQYNNFRSSNSTKSTQQSQTNPPPPPPSTTSTAGAEQCLQEQQPPLLVVSGNAAQDQEQSQQESKQSSEENESSQRQSAAQGSGQQMSSAAPGGGQQPAKTTNSSGDTNEQSRAQAHLLALRMTEQVQQQMAQAQHQIAKVQVQLENGKAANESTETSMNQTQSSQEQTEEQEPVQQQQQQQQQLPEETQSLLQQQSQAAANYPCEMFNQGSDLYQALTSQQTLMALAPMANPMMSNQMMANAMMPNPMMANPMMTNSMMANSYPLPFGDMPNSNFFTGTQPFPSNPLPPQAYGSGLMGPPMPPMGPQMPQNSFMGLPNNFPISGFGHNGGNDGFMPPPATPMPSQQNFDAPNMYPCQNNHCYMPCHRPRYNNMRFMMPRWH